VNGGGGGGIFVNFLKNILLKISRFQHIVEVGSEKYIRAFKLFFLSYLFNSQISLGFFAKNPKK
jgi:hypothetical protein